MLVLLALGGITFVVWVTMVGVSFLDQEPVASLRMSVKRNEPAVRDGEGEQGYGIREYSRRREEIMVREPGASGGRRWSIVLASEDGVGMRPAFRPSRGRNVSGPYRRVIESRSMFQHTLDRTMQVTSPARTVVVVTRDHREAWAQIGPRDPGMVLVQPRNLGTASGVFLSLTYIRARDPEGTALISLSGPIASPEERYLREALYAVRAAEQLPTKLVLLASRPEGPHTEYGWIVPDHQLLSFGSRSIRAVKAFIERPEPPLAQLAYTSGALWNRFVMAGKVDAFWNVGRKVLPNMMVLFERLTEAIDTPKEAEVLRTMYKRLPCLSFSRDLLEQAPGEAAVMEMIGLTHRS